MNARPQGGDLRVVVAVLASARPAELAELLPDLVAQRASVTDSVDLLVVDPQASSGVREQVAAFGSGVRYVRPADLNVAAARNAALDEAADADLLVFLDDDQRPVARWLSRLLAAWREHRSTAVAGPVLSSFEVEPGDWIRDGRFFTPRRLPSATRIEVAQASNLLLDVAELRRLQLRFDPRFGPDGSDTLFSRELIARGGSMVWCDEAILTDVIPAFRATRTHVLRRQHTSGSCWARAVLAVSPFPLPRLGTRIALAAGGVVRVVLGGLLTAVGLLLPALPWHARGRKAIARGSGLLAGALSPVPTR